MELVFLVNVHENKNLKSVTFFFSLSIQPSTLHKWSWQLSYNK